ncbi:MAG: DUF4422 domain-containing protein [Oscillospiraceae bacterium]|nr:DUF4422 domain-containing protein [Oscillospiraceae bacterium]
MKIIVATHKEYPIPTEPPYETVYTNRGAELDDKAWCELSALYSFWKKYSPLSSDTAYGMVHYRRYFGKGRPYTGAEFAAVMQNADILLPKKRNYIIQNNYDHYIRSHSKANLDAAYQIIRRDYPDYANGIDIVNRRVSANMFNMFVMTGDFFEDYCGFLFGVLRTLEKEISPTEPRVYGFVSELLQNIWLERKKTENNTLRITELPVYYPEGDPIFKKGIAMLGRMVKRKSN